MEPFNITNILTENIKYVAVDFDNTLIKPLDFTDDISTLTFIQKANKHIVALIKDLLKNNIKVGIASFANYDDLIQETTKELFGVDIPLQYGLPSDITIGKEQHIIKLFGHVPHNQTLLIDDQQYNIDSAKKHNRHTYFLIN